MARESAGAHEACLTDRTAGGGGCGGAGGLSFCEPGHRDRCLAHRDVSAAPAGRSDGRVCLGLSRGAVDFRCGCNCAGDTSRVASFAAADGGSHGGRHPEQSLEQARKVPALGANCSGFKGGFLEDADHVISGAWKTDRWWTLSSRGPRLVPVELSPVNGRQPVDLVWSGTVPIKIQPSRACFSGSVAQWGQARPLIRLDLQREAGCHPDL